MWLTKAYFPKYTNSLHNSTTKNKQPNWKMAEDLNRSLSKEKIQMANRRKKRYLISLIILFSSVQLLSHVWLFASPWTVARQASLSITSTQSLFKLMSIESVMWSKHLLSPSPPDFNLFQHQSLFFNESVLCIRWPKYWSFSFSISPSNEYSGLISFRFDWLDLLVVQGTLKSFPTPQFKSIISLHSAFFTVQLSHPYMTTGKTIVLTIQNLSAK